MALPKLFETPAGVSPCIIVYRNKPDQVFIQFLEEGMAVNDFTVDDRLLHADDMHRVYDFSKNVDKLPTIEQRAAFQIVRNWLINQ
jgi:hypothetical protein